MEWMRVMVSASFWFRARQQPRQLMGQAGLAAAGGTHEQQMVAAGCRKGQSAGGQAAVQAGPGLRLVTTRFEQRERMHSIKGHGCSPLSCRTSAQVGRGADR